MGFDFVMIASLLPSHCPFSFVFACGVSFLVSSSVFLSMIVQHLVVILVLSQRGVNAHPSTLLSWTNLEHVNFFFFNFFFNFNFFYFLKFIYLFIYGCVGSSFLC